jgi:hypothetical protein
MAAEQVDVHLLDKEVSGLLQWKREFPATVDLKIQNAVSGIVIKILSGIGLLLAAQTMIEKFLGTA